MWELLRTITRSTLSALQPRRDLALENLALRQQLAVLRRDSSRPQLEDHDRLFWIGHRPPSQTWRTFLDNHAEDIAAVDFFTVPTATFRVLYVLLVMSHDRRKIIHFNVTDSPSSGWTGRQLREAFPFDTAPRFLLRDNDTKFLGNFTECVEALGILQVTTTPHSPWQNAYCERLIGSIRRECTDHVIVLNERHLRRILRGYVDYYQRSRTHRSLCDDCPVPRKIEPPPMGEVIAFPKAGGLHHRYSRRLAA